MEFEKLPEDIVQMILDRIDSVPHLEALMLIHEAAPRALTSAEIGARLYVSAGAADKILQDLQRHGLIVAGPNAGSYLLSPQPDNLTEVSRLATTYRQNVSRVAGLIHARGSRSVREFAKAFDMKGKDPKGGSHG